MWRRPSERQQNFGDLKVGFLGVFKVVKPTSRNLPLPARPGSPGTVRENPKGPAPPSCVPRTALIPIPRATPTSAPSRFRASTASPKLARVQRAGLPGSAALGAQPAVWFELGSADRSLWPRHPSGSLAEAWPLRWPARQQPERATPGAAAGQGIQTHVESFYLIKRGGNQRRLPGRPARATSCGTRAAPTDRGENWGRSPHLRAHHPWIRQAAREEVPAPLPLHVPPPAWHRPVVSPSFPPPSSLAPSHTHREGRLQAQRQRAEPEPERRAPHATQTGGGSSAGCSGRSYGLRGAPGRLSRLLRFALLSPELAQSTAVPRDGCTFRQLESAPNCQIPSSAPGSVCSGPHLSRRAPPYDKPTGS